MKKRAALTLAGGLLATLAISGVAAAGVGNENCGHANPSFSWALQKPATMAQPVVGNPELEADTFYCVRINGAGKTVVSHAVDLGL